MFDKLDFIVEKYKDMSLKVSDPDVIADQPTWQKYIKDMGEMEPIVKKYEEYKKAKDELAMAKEILETENDEELRDLAKLEVNDNEEKIEVLSDELRVLLIPKDPNDDKNVILEVRAGTGGEEAALFGQNLLSHRVQRVPETESSGRIHTSAATVAVLPEVEDVDVALDPNDVRVDVYRASGNGGQCVNTTDSAVRLTHVPTGLVVTCQDEKSQIKNKEKAFKVLKSRLYDLKLQEQQSEIAAERRSQIGSGDRSERIRTYNFPQGRCTEHRIGMTLYKLDAILDGDIDEIIDGLITNDQAEKMKAF